MFQTLVLGILPLLISGHYYKPDGEPEHLSAIIEPTKGLPWPYPQQIQSTKTVFAIDSDNFKFIHHGDCDIVKGAIKRYEAIIFKSQCREESLEKLKFKDNLMNLTITVQKCEDWPYLNMDEQYELKINSPDQPGLASLYSTSVWGALRGLETFSQLVLPYTQTGIFYVNSTTILDFPRFTHRGTLLDTSRHYIALDVILKNIEAMAQNKMNVFHWHIVDDQSFPFESSRFPDLSDKGAYFPSHIYSPRAVKKVIEFSRQRGIRVIIEFDSPGHTLSWGKGQPGLLTPCYTKGKPDGTFGPVNPTVNSTYDFMKAFFSDIAGVFPDAYIHLGGDEVSFNCWESNPDLTEFMKEHGYGTDYSKLEAYYIQRLLNIVKETKKNYIIWQEVIDNNVEVLPDTVVHVWKDPHPEEMAKVTQKGLKALLSTCWYLDYISLSVDWRKYYVCDPHAFNGTDQQKSLVMGGEACLWGEYVDKTNAIPRMWPRASAVAERLWSSQSLSDPDAAAGRFEEHRCRMVKRGFNAQPPGGPGTCPCDYMFSCSEQ